jgi:hypothetical protein
MPILRRPPKQVPIPTELSLIQHHMPIGANSPSCECTEERLDNYDLWFDEGSKYFGKCLYQAVDDLRKPLTWSSVESEIVLKSKGDQGSKPSATESKEEDYTKPLKWVPYHSEVVLRQKWEELQLKQATNPPTTEEEDFVIEDYSTRSFVVHGDGTKKYKEILRTLGGKWNPSLTDKDSGKRFGGWIFSNKLRKFVEEEFQYC